VPTFVIKPLAISERLLPKAPASLLKINQAFQVDALLFLKKKMNATAFASSFHMLKIRRLLKQCL
jgi:hypothetical protein